MTEYGVRLTCDRCGESESIYHEPEHREHDWGIIKYKGMKIDICPTCMEMLSTANDDYFWDTSNGTPIGTDLRIPVSSE